MKKSGTTIVFVLVCIGVLVAAYAIGVCIREIRFGEAVSGTVAAETKESPPAEVEEEPQQPESRMPVTASEGDTEPAPQQRPAFGGGGQMTGMRDRFENMTDEEREAFRSQMRERFGGRRRGDSGPQVQLTEEQRTQMREEIDAIRAKWEEMSEAEREQARNEITEKYGFSPRGLGGGRGFGDGEGGRRRPSPRPDAEQTENN